MLQAPSQDCHRYPIRDAVIYEVTEFEGDEGHIIAMGSLEFCCFFVAARMKQLILCEASLELAPSTLNDWMRECLKDGYCWCDEKSEYWMISRTSESIKRFWGIPLT